LRKRREYRDEEGVEKKGGKKRKKKKKSKPGCAALAKISKKIVSY